MRAFGGVKALALAQEIFCVRVHSKLFFDVNIMTKVWRGGGGLGGSREAAIF